jgi:hypothetical protein
MKIFTLIAIVFLFQSNILKAQYIWNLEIIPPNPTVEDSIKIISKIGLPQSNCPLDSSSIVINNNSIAVYTFHTSGMQTTPCTAKDTSTIGKLDAGVYELSFFAGRTSSLTIHDTNTIVFTVQKANNVLSIDNSSQGINIYPNPASSDITIDFKNNLGLNHVVEIYSMIGENVATISGLTDRSKIGLNDLADGVYFIVIINEANGRWVQKVIKNSK